MRDYASKLLLKYIFYDRSNGNMNFSLNQNQKVGALADIHAPISGPVILS